MSRLLFSLVWLTLLTTERHFWANWMPFLLDRDSFEAWNKTKTWKESLRAWLFFWYVSYFYRNSTSCKVRHKLCCIFMEYKRLKERSKSEEMSRSYRFEENHKTIIYCHIIAFWMDYKSYIEDLIFNIVSRIKEKCNHWWSQIIIIIIKRRTLFSYLYFDSVVSFN